MQHLIRWREDDRRVIRRRLAYSKSGHGDSHVDEETLGKSASVQYKINYSSTTMSLSSCTCQDAARHG